MTDTTQTGIAMAVVAALCTIAGSLIGWLKDRDKLKYDRDLDALRAQNALQASQIQALTATQAACEKKHEECEAKHETLELRLSQIETALAQRK